MKKNLSVVVFALLGLIIFGCNKEEPLPVSAKFTTNIQNNTLGTKQGFTVYLDDVKGEFFAYFKGDKEETTWPGGYGIPFNVGSTIVGHQQKSDSIIISAYGIEGTFTFTLVATSYGNWGETVEQDVQSIDITVVAEQ